MGKYGNTSLLAVELIKERKEIDPRVAWKKAVNDIFPNSESSRNKGCPKDTFLGICEDGLVRGVNSGSYTRSEKNKKYGLDALSILNKQPHLASNEKALWRIIMAGENKQHNSQMDVVTTLWQHNLIKHEKL